MRKIEISEEGKLKFLKIWFQKNFIFILLILFITPFQHQKI